MRPPPFLPLSALSLELDAFVAATASMHAGFAEARVAFDCSFPRVDDDMGFLVLGGLEPLLDALERFRLKADELAWLEALGAIDGQARKRLIDMRFGCDVDAAPEGSIVFPGEPVLMLEGPFWQAQLVGAMVRSSLSYATRTATRAARAVIAAEGCEIIEASAATAHRGGGNPLIARAAYVGGAHATTSALAARRYGIPVRASLPLRFALAAEPSSSGFDAWLRASQGRAILRVDPHSPAASIADVIAAVQTRTDPSRWNDAEVAVEIDGGDHIELARMIGQAFREAGLAEPAIVASGDLDEHQIAQLRRHKAPISAFVLTSFGVDDAWLARYDMAALESDGQWSPRFRTGATVAESSDPGRKVVVRYHDSSGHLLGDVAHATGERVQSPRDVHLVDRTSGFPGKLRAAATSAPLLTNVMRAGKRVSSIEQTRDIRARVAQGVASLPERYRRLRTPARYPVGLSPALAAIKADLVARSP